MEQYPKIKLFWIAAKIVFTLRLN